MFEQNPTLGPGTGTTTSHTLEILLMLAVAFLLGLWLGWLLWNRYKALVETAKAESASLKMTIQNLEAEIEGHKKRLVQVDADNATLRLRLNSMSSENVGDDAKIEDLSHQLMTLRLKNSDLEAEIARLNEPIATSYTDSIPMEVVDSPIDVHVNDLIETAETAEPIETLDLPPIVVVEPSKTEAETTTSYAAEEEKMEQDAMPADEKPAEPAYIGSIFTPTVAADKLQVVEGIGPKIEKLLHENGILTFRQLADAPTERLREILHAAGSRYSMHDPTSWPEQARLADEGDWDSLKAWQDELKGGRVPTAAPSAGYGENEVETAVSDENFIENESKTDEPMALTNEELADIIEMPTPEIIDLDDESAPTGYDEEPAFVAPDDLKIVEGIGPKIEDLLQKSGITTFSQLAATPVSRIKELLDAAGPSFSMHDPGTWPAQALLAANGEVENLIAYQGFLNAGKRPS